MRAKKILLLGAQAVGKTSIARRLKFDTFEHDYKSTIGVQLHEINLSFDEQIQPVVIWDTDGNFGDKIFESVYVKGASGALVVADCSRPHTIDHMQYLISCFEQMLPGRPCFGVLNKTDREMPSDAAISRIGTNLQQLHLCSALTGQGLLRATHSLLEASNNRDAAW